MRRVLWGAAGAAILIAGFQLVSFVRSGQAAAAWHATVAAGWQITADAGFAVGEVIVTGRALTEGGAVVQALDARHGDPLLAVDRVAVRDALESLPTVRRAWVTRVLPGQLTIALEERVPLALWHAGGVRASTAVVQPAPPLVIDAEGVVLGADVESLFGHLPQVAGSDAPDHAAPFLGLLADHPQVAARVETAVRVGQRRWDLLLDNGVMVLLPAEAPGAALDRVARLDRDAGLFDRAVTHIDLRLADRVVIREMADAAEDRRSPPVPDVDPASVQEEEA